MRFVQANDALPECMSGRATRTRPVAAGSGRTASPTALPAADGGRPQPAHRALYNAQPHTKVLTRAEFTHHGKLSRKSVLIALIFPFVKDLDSTTTQHKPLMASLHVCCRTDYGGGIIVFSAPWWPIWPIFFLKE